MCDSRRPYPFDLSDAEWALLASLLPPQPAPRGRRYGRAASPGSLSRTARARTAIGVALSWLERWRMR